MTSLISIIAVLAAHYNSFGNCFTTTPQVHNRSRRILSIQRTQQLLRTDDFSSTTPKYSSFPTRGRYLFNDVRCSYKIKDEDDSQGSEKTPIIKSRGRKYRKRSDGGRKRYSNRNGRNIVQKRKKYSNKVSRQWKNIIFTRHSTAESLQQSQVMSVQENDSKTHQDSNVGKSQFVTSPSVLQNNKEECMPYICGDLPITYTNDPKQITKWLKEHVHDNYIGDCGDCYINTFVGFDVESVPNVPWRTPTNAKFSNRPATVQISSPYSALVIHLTDKSVIPPLKTFLSDETIVKVGAGIDEDMLELYRWDSSLQARSRFDIGGVGTDSKCLPVGLQKLVRAIDPVR